MSDVNGKVSAERPSGWKSAIWIAGMIGAIALCVAIFVAAEHSRAERERKRQRRIELNYRLKDLNVARHTRKLNADEMREATKEFDAGLIEKRELDLYLDKGSLVSRFLSLFR